VGMNMEYDARKDSLLSEQESEKVEIYFTIKRFNASAVSLEIYLQETDKPKKLLMKTKQQEANNQIYEFSQSLVVEYFFESKNLII
jgi:hypothetical protein